MKIDQPTMKKPAMIALLIMLAPPASRMRCHSWSGQNLDTIARLNYTVLDRKCREKLVARLSRVVEFVCERSVYFSAPGLTSL